jgi:signal transduction histidine kinase
LRGNAGLVRTTWALVFLLAFLGLDQISSLGPAPPLVLTPWNPALGLCVAAVMRQRTHMLAFVFLGPLLSQFIAPDLPQAVLYGVWTGAVAVAETMAVVAGSQWLMKAVSNPLLKNELSAVLLSSLPVAFIGAVMRIGFLIVIGEASAHQFGEGVLRFWVGDVIGIFIVAPLCLLALSFRRPRTFDLRRSVEIALQAAVVLGAVWLAFGEHPQSASRYFYTVFLPMIWIVLRFGVNGAIIMNAFVQISMVVSLSWAGHDKVDVTLFQAFLLVLAASSLTLGLAVDQSRLATQQLRARENELSASLKISATGELAGALAHELGHPLGAISNYAAALNHVLARFAPAESEGRNIAHKLSREIVRATDTLHRLRDFFRTGSLVVERVDVTTLLKEAISMLDDRFERCNIKLHILIQSGLNRVQADRIQLHAVIHNLLINAIDALLLVPAENRALSITLSRTDNAVVLEIDDSGIGVAPDVRDHIFEPLTTTKKNGLGLGLSMCKSIVAAHGGSIYLGDSRLGGAKFVVTLPTGSV